MCNAIDEPSEEDSALQIEALQTAFAGLARFPNLRALQLDFHGIYQEDEAHDIGSPSHFLRLQLGLFATLAAVLLPFTSLKLNNVIPKPDDIYTQQDFLGILRPLKELSISVISDIWEGAYQEEPLVEFWEISVAKMVRSAVSVTTLTLGSNQAVGACPVLPIADTFLPQLSSLTLRNFALEPSNPTNDVLAFILRHKSTLTHLELHDCTLDGGEELDYPRPWHVVFSLLETELSVLRSFALINHAYERNEEDEWEMEQELDERYGPDPRFAYTRLDPGWGYHPVSTLEIDGTDMDLPALESLITVVEARNQS
jgi:hypothetical protein